MVYILDSDCSHTMDYIYPDCVCCHEYVYPMHHLPWNNAVFTSTENLIKESIVQDTSVRKRTRDEDITDESSREAKRQRCESRDDSAMDTM